MVKILAFSNSSELPENCRQLITHKGFPVIYLPREDWNADRLISMGLAESVSSERQWLGLVDLDGNYSTSEIRYLKELTKWGVHKLCFSRRETNVQFNKLSALFSHGFIFRGASERAWSFALTSIDRSGVYWPDYVVNEISALINKVHKTQRNEGVQLTVRQQQVLQAIKKGKTNQQISLQLGVTVYTAKSHIAALFKKLHVHNRMECLFRAEQDKLF
ncbi:MAG: hypothetical protein COB04_02925 [Gammaproteobacteria bacterium]|nr:MAG: hypothetical protein COB04_02925 [Gammaproteobacteria bacterium]